MKQQFQPSAPEGKTLRIDFIDKSADDVETDHEVDMEVGFSPGTPVKAPVASNFEAAVEGVKAELTELAPLDVNDIQEAIPGWKEKFGFTELAVTEGAADWDITGAMSPGKPVAKPKIPGTKQNPFKLAEWPKPASSAYPPLYFGGQINRVRSQRTLQQNEGKEDATGTVIRKYTPHAGGRLPGGAKIGITPQFRVAEGTVVGPLSQATTPGGETLLSELRPYGFSASGEGLDGDHVREIQFGGQDTLGNLWPLNASINRGAGSTLAGATVTYPGGTREVKIADLKQNARSYFFEIVKTR